MVLGSLGRLATLVEELVWLGVVMHSFRSTVSSVVWVNNDDVIKWKHFLRYWPFVRGIHQSPLNSPHKGQWRGALMCSLICAWINGWLNNREAGYFRRNSANYGVTVKPTSVHLSAVGYCRSLFLNSDLIFAHNIHFGCPIILRFWKTRWVDGTPTTEVTPVTIW